MRVASKITPQRKSNTTPVTCVEVVGSPGTLDAFEDKQTIATYGLGIRTLVGFVGRKAF